MVRRSVERRLDGVARIVGAASFVEGVNHIDRRGFEALIVDVKLQEGSGFDVIAHARTLNLKIPALAISDDASFANRAYALQIQFLQKPIDSQGLMEFVRRSTHKRDGAREVIASMVAIWSDRFDLTPSERRILVAVVVEEVPRRDLGRVLGKSDATVKTQARHLLAKTPYETLSDATAAILRDAIRRY